MRAPIAPQHDHDQASRRALRRRLWGWRNRLLAAGVMLGLAVAQLDVHPATAAGNYLLLSRDRLMSLPTDTAAWQFVVRTARGDWPAPELDDQDNKTNVMALAAALVYARTGDGEMRARARNAIERMIPTYNLSMDAGLGPARQITGWVLTADFIGLDGGLDGEFRDLLRRALTKPIGTHSRWGGSLRACHEDSDNNWGAWCGASRIAAARYLGDAAELERAERVYRGFLGDRDAWSEFRGQGSSNDALNSAIRTWSCDASPASYVPTNPACGDRSGAFPADASRLGAYREFDAAYQSETTAGIVLAAELLHQAGYTGAWTNRNALARIAAFDYEHGAWNLGGAQYHWPWLVNRRLGTSYPTKDAGIGRSLGYTDWLYGGGGGGGGGGEEPPRTPDPTREPTPAPTAGPVDPAPTPAPTRKGKGRGNPHATATPRPPSITSNGGAPLAPAGGLTTGSNDGSTGSAGAGGGDAQAAGPASKQDGKGGSGGGKRDGTALGSSSVTSDAERGSAAAQLALAAVIAGLLALALLRTRRRPGSS